MNQSSSPLKGRVKPKINCIKDTRGSTWEKDIGINRKKNFYQNSSFQYMLAHPRTGHRAMGNHHAQTYLFWRQVGRDMEGAGKVLLGLVAQHLEICCIELS